MRGGKPGTRPNGGIMGIGGAFGAFAGAGAAAAFSFLTLEAGFLGMVPCTRWRRRTWGRGAGMPLRWATAVVPRSQGLRGAAARKARGCAVGNELALHETQAQCARVVLAAPLSLCGPGPSWLEFTDFD